VDNYLLFLMMSFLLIILPGPNTGLVVQNTISYGKKSGIKTVFGSVSGLLVHTLAVVFGLSAIIVKSAFVFSIFKYVGAIYLIYLGFVSLKSLRMNSNKEQLEQRQLNRKNKSYFLQGFITCVGNPKVAVFFLTFLPQFVEPGSHHFIQFLTLGTSYAILNIIWYLIYIYLIDFFSVYMKKPSVKNVIQGLSGTVLLWFGIKLALEKKP
jgi:threonine/homoserine/homoserine lactone efflux protein